MNVSLESRNRLDVDTIAQLSSKLVGNEDSKISDQLGVKLNKTMMGGYMSQTGLENKKKSTGKQEV